MKSVNPDVLALINATIAGTASAVDFDCYTITLASGTVLRFTTADFDIADGTGNTWSSTGIRVDEKKSKVTAHWKTGLDTDTWVVVIMPRAVDPVTGQAFPDTIDGVPWLQAAQGGALDAADFQVDRAYFSAMPTWPMPPGGAVPLGFVSGVFAGVVAEVDTTEISAVLSINDYRSLLSIQMPLHFWSGTCRHTLFDNGCAIAKSIYPVFGAAIGGSTPGSIANTLGVPTGQLLVSDGLIGFWPLDAASVDFTTGVVADLSGNNNNGVLNGDWTSADLLAGPNAWNDGALNFDGNSNITADCFTGLSAFSQCFWIKAPVPSTSAANISGVITNGLSTLGWSFSWNWPGDATLTNAFLMEDTGGLSLIQADFTFADLVWYFVICEWDGSVMNVYVDDVLCGSTPQADPLVDVVGTFNIGGINQFGRAYFVGELAGVRTYDRILSPAEKQLLKLGAPVGSETYVLGSIKMTSGLNKGFSRTITGWNGPGQPLTLLQPFPFPVASGDEFVVYPGCNKTQGTCTAFGNLVNFGGQPYVPAPETAT